LFDRVKFRRSKKTIAAAVRIEPELYAFAAQRIEADDSNFSRYVRGLIRADLSRAGMLRSRVAAAVSPK
jgi:hypothetical protein